MSAKRTELQRLLSKRGIASRSRSAALVKAGKVRVEGRIERNPAAYVPIDARVEVEGVPTAPLGTAERILIAFHKPKGVVTTRADERGRMTVYDLLPEKYRGLSAIGRLDMATTGLLLFTNDTILADRLLDPARRVEKTYVVTVRGDPDESAMNQFCTGIEDGGDILRAKEVLVRKRSRKESILIMTLTEGKNRAIRRMCDRTGHEVLKLKRISFAGYTLADLPPGEVKLLDFPAD